MSAGTALLSVTFTVSAGAQTLWEVRTVNGMRYLQSQRDISVAGGSSFQFAARGATCVMTHELYVPPEDPEAIYIVARALRAEGTTIWGPIYVDPDTALFGGFSNNVGFDGMHSGILWTDTDVQRFRVFDAAGVPLGPGVVIADSYADANARPRVAANGEGFAVALALIAPPGFNRPRVNVVLTGLDGTPRGAPIQVCDSYSVRPTVDFLPDGSTIVGYRRRAGSYPNEEYYCGWRRVTAQLELGPIVEPFAGPTIGLRIRALPDGSVRVVYQRFPEDGTAFTQHFTVAGEALSPPLPIDGTYRDVAIDEIGRIALVFSGQNNVWAQLHDESGQSLGARFAVPLTQDRLDYSVTAGVHSSVAYSEGMVWFNFIGTPPYTQYLSTLRPLRVGDMNADRAINNFDIDPFVLALSDPAAYEAATGIPADVGAILGDCNEDGALNNFDIDAFVELLTGG